MSRLIPCLVAAIAVGCAFTAEPDPGGVADVSDAGGPNGNPDAGAGRDGGYELDAHAPPPADAAFDAPPDPEPEPDISMQADDGGIEYDAAGDAAPDAEADAQFDADVDGGPDAAPDAGAPTPEWHCDVACTALATCGPGPEPAECRRECLAEDDDTPGTAARLDDCVDAHIAGGRCDIAGLQTCMSDEPLPLDPHCVIACDALDACGLPARPDCADACTEEPGPERQRLARCVEAHVVDAQCDGIGFIGCADQPPTVDDVCHFICDSLSACAPVDGPSEGCVDDCAAEDQGLRRAGRDCAAIHLDRARCDDEGFEACVEP